MIIDKLENAYLYYDMNKHIEKGLKYLQSEDLESIPEGKYEIDGERIYANVQSGMTKDPKDAPWEIHKTYTDIQYVIKGAELMGWTNREKFHPTEAYDIEKDIMFGNAQGTYIPVDEGYFVIFTPEDAHKPMLKIGSEQNVKKVIVKVKC